MISARFCLLSLVLLTGCRTATKVGVTTFKVLDTPAHYIREKIDQSEGQTTTTTTTTTTTGAPPVSDVTTPGRQVTTVSPQPRPSPSRDVAANTHRKPASASSPRPNPSSTSEFPVAKPVPGKPGFVYSVDPQGGIVDVTGYKSGDKAKDPYSKKIFIVP